MISYFIVAHCMLTTNFSSRLKFQFHVIFGQDSFPLNMGSFQASLLLQNYTNCLLTNGWSRTVSSRTVSSQMDGGMPAFTITFNFAFTSAWFVFICLFICLQMVAFDTFSMISSLIFLNKSFLRLDAGSAS